MKALISMLIVAARVSDGIRVYNADELVSEADIHCSQTATDIRCDSQKIELPISRKAPFPSYTVYFQTPDGSGWNDNWNSAKAVVLLFHGTDMQYSSPMLVEPFAAKVGSYFEERAKTIKKLLEAGFAVVAPEAKTHKLSNWVGYTYWDINRESHIFKKWRHWKDSGDSYLMQALFDKFKGRELHAIGFSSGGYHISRVGNDPFYSHKIRSLVIVGGTCQWNCDKIDQNHPPTLFLHGKYDFFANTTDYEASLAKAGIEVEAVTKDVTTEVPWGPHKGKKEVYGGLPFQHMWIPGSSDLCVDWVKKHSKATMAADNEDGE